MKWEICLTAALAALCGGIVWALSAVFSRGRKKSAVNPLMAVSVGTFAAAFLMFLPIYWEYFLDDGATPVKTLLLSAHNAIRLFVIDCDFDTIKDAVTGLPGVLRTLYSSFAAVVYVMAPVLTFGVVLSILKNALSYQRLMAKYFRNAYVFSELNAKSLTLAQSLRESDPKAAIVFTDVFEKEEEEAYERLAAARDIGALCFQKDILALSYRFRSPRTKLCFFAIGEDEAENIQQTLSLIREYSWRENTRLYLFSTSTESELLLNKADKGKTKVRRINDVQSLVYGMLWQDGQKLYESAKPLSSGEKLIHAVIVGMGQHGTEFMRALAWMGQMDGYRLWIDAIDRDPLAESRFRALCPELMDDAYNGVYRQGEAQYDIRIHSGIDVSSWEFNRLIGEMGDATFVFVSLGSDSANIEAAVRLRMLFERMHIHPDISAVVYDSVRKEALSGACNYAGQPYDLRFCGDLKTAYSCQTILNSELEADALARHLKWGKEESAFWAYGYYYRSSVASSIHLKMRIACGIPNADRKEEDLTPEEKKQLQTLEHRRWNAYMRSEGYVYSGSPDQKSRNDLGKMHHNLVYFDALSQADKNKDSRVGTR